MSARSHLNMPTTLTPSFLADLKDAYYLHPVVDSGSRTGRRNLNFVIIVIVLLIPPPEFLDLFLTFAMVIVLVCKRELIDLKLLTVLLLTLKIQKCLLNYGVKFFYSLDSQVGDYSWRSLNIHHNTIQCAPLDEGRISANSHLEW